MCYHHTIAYHDKNHCMYVGTYVWSTVLCYPRPNLELQLHTTAFMTLRNLKYLYKCNFMNSFLGLGGDNRSTEKEGCV